MSHINPKKFVKMVDAAAKSLEKGPVKTEGPNGPKHYTLPSKGDNDGKNTPPY